jgi:uncharacterized membrane protein
MMRAVRLLNVLLLLALWGGALWYWGTLPERVPTHFDARGLPDAWGAKGFASWFLLPTIALATVSLMYVSVWLVRRRPTLLNIPRKKELLELSAADQAPVLRVVAATLEAMTAGIVLIFCAIQLATYRAAFGDSVRPLMLVVLVVAVVGLPLLTLVLIARISALIRDAHRRARARGTLRGNTG